MDMFVGVHDSDWLHGGKAIAAWYTLKGEMEVPADGNECVNVDWILKPCTELSETAGWGIEGRKSSFLDFGEKSIWMTIRHAGDCVDAQLYQESGARERGWAGRIKVGLTSIDVTLSLRGLDEVNHRIGL